MVILIFKPEVTRDDEFMVCCILCWREDSPEFSKFEIEVVLFLIFTWSWFKLPIKLSPPLPVLSSKVILWVTLARLWTSLSLLLCPWSPMIFGNLVCTGCTLSLFPFLFSLSVLPSISSNCWLKSLKPTEAEFGSKFTMMMVNDVAAEDDEEEYSGKNDDNTDDLNKHRKRNVRGGANRQTIQRWCRWN